MEHTTFGAVFASWVTEGFWEARAAALCIISAEPSVPDKYEHVEQFKLIIKILCISVESILSDGGSGGHECRSPLIISLPGLRTLLPHPSLLLGERC